MPKTIALPRLLTFSLLALLTIPSLASARYTDIEVNNSRFCGLLENGKVDCVTTFDGSNPIHQPNPNLTFSEIQIGNHYGCGITSEATVECWGAPTHEGEINPPSFDSPVISLTVAPYHACAIDSAHNIKCWGQNVHGQTNPPEPASGYINAHAFGIYSSCGLTSGGEFNCWGRPGYGLTTPAVDGFTTTLTEITTNQGITCGLRSDGSADCWQASIGNLVIAEFRNGPYKEVFPMDENNRYPACALTFNGELDCVDGPSSTQGETPALPLPVNRLSATYKAVAAHYQRLYGYTANNRLETISDDIGGYSQTLLDIVNGELDMPSIQLTSAAFYGDEIGVELFFSVTGADAYRYRHDYDTEVYRDGELLDTTDNFGSYMDRTATEGQLYDYELRAKHAFGQLGDYSNLLAVSTDPTPASNPTDGEATRPHAPQNLRGEVYWYDVELFWDRNQSGNVRNYEIRRNGEFLTTTRGTSWYDNTTTGGELYQFDVIAVGHDDSILGLESVRVQIGAASCN